jgi:hypothetical protein
LIFLPSEMTEREIQQHIATLQSWLADAWRRLSDPAMTTFEKREVRNQMKQADAALRRCLALSSELKSAPKPPAGAAGRTIAKPDLRFLA